MPDMPSNIDSGKSRRKLKELELPRPKRLLNRLNDASMLTTNSTKLPLITDALLTVIAMVSVPAQPLDSARARLDQT